MALMEAIGSFLSAGADDAAEEAGQLQARAAKKAGRISGDYEGRMLSDIGRTSAGAVGAISQAEARALASRKQAGQILTDAEERALAEFSGGEARSLNALREGTGAAQEYYQPFTEQGTAAFNEQAALNGLLGPEAQAAARARFTTDPGYNFRLEQGVNALDRSASARGGLYSGAAAKALTEYGQGMGSAEYGNYYDRLGGQAAIGYNSAGQQAGLAAGLGANEANVISGAAGNRAGVISGTGAARAELGAQDAQTILGSGADRANILLGAGRDRLNALTLGRQGQIDATTGAANALAAGTVGAANARSAGINNLLQIGGRIAGAYAGRA